MKRYWVIAPADSTKSNIFEKAWKYDLAHGTIAIGWSRAGDVSKLSEEELKAKLVDKYPNAQLTNAFKCLWSFYHEIKPGDIIIARQGIKRLFGIGEVISAAFYDENEGRKRVEQFTGDFYYPQFLKIKWESKQIDFESQVFLRNTVHEITEDKYNLLIQGKSEGNVEALDKTVNKKINKPLEVICEPPNWLESLIKDMENLKKDEEHKERAHESLVESFYELLGFKKFNDIKHRQGRIDISVEYQGKTIIVNEVKKDWNLTYRDKSTIIQAYNYSLESGARFVVITNGDYYAMFDKDKGRSYESNFIGDFQLSKLESSDLELIDFLRKDKITSLL